LEQIKAEEFEVKYLHERQVMSFHTDFVLGVSGHPEKHFEAPSIAVLI